MDEQKEVKQEQDEVEDRETTTTDDAPVEEKDESSESSGDEKRFTQEDVERIVKDRLKRAKDKADAETAKAKEEAEAKAMQEQQQFKELSEKYALKISELEPQAQQVERYEATLKTLLDAEKKSVPDHVLALLEKLDPIEQLEWLSKNEEKVRGIPQTPRRGDARGASEEQRRAAQTAAADAYRRRF